MDRAFAIVICSFLALTANAATFRLEHDGKPIPGGDVCLFDAKSLNGPLERLTTFHKVECFPADGDVPLPKGTWNIVARNPEGFVARGLLLVRDGRVSDDRRVIELERAGRAQLEFVPSKTESVGVYVEKSGVVIPVVPGERDVLLPLESRLFLLVMEGDVVRGVGAGFVLTSGNPVGVARPAVVAGQVDFATGVVADRDAFARIPARERAPGEIHLTSEAGKALPSANRVERVFKGDDGLALFRNVPAAAGGGVVHVVGDGWSGTGGQLAAFRAEGPLRVAPTTSLAVRWSVLDDLIRLAEQLRARPACPRAEEAAAQSRDIPGVAQTGLTLSLAQCPGLQSVTPPRSVRKTACKLVASAVLDESEMSGTNVVNGVAPGVYLLRLGYEDLPAAFETIEVADADESAAIELKYDRWFGKVTRGGEPLYAEVSIGEGAVTDPDTGEYFAVSIPVPPPPPAVASRFFTDPPPIEVIGCDSEIETLYAPDERPIPNTRFDIDIEPNAIKVSVIDSGSGNPIPKAVVDLSVVRRDRPDAALFAGGVGTTDEAGSVEVKDLPPTREIKLCASHDDYQRRCADRFTLKKEREKSLTIALDRAEVRAGRVFHPAVGGGQVIWYSVDGRNLESVSVEADGAFRYKQKHAAGEVVCVVSAGAPLLVLRQPHLRDDEPFDIRYPSAPVRSFNLSLSAEAREQKGFVSLSIGDIVVPLNVLSQHLRPRGARPMFLAPGQLEVRDIVASGPVSFIFAPMSWVETYGKETNIDFFYLPAAGALPRVAAGSDANVVVGN